MAQVSEYGCLVARKQPMVRLLIIEMTTQQANKRREDMGAPATKFTSAPAAVSHTVGTFDVYVVGNNGQA